LRRTHVLSRQREDPEDLEEMRTVLPHYHEYPPADLPAHVGKHLTAGYAFEAPVVWMPKYLAYLRASCRKAEVHLHQGVHLPPSILRDGSGLLRLLRAWLPGGSPEFPLVINCLGLANREISQDAAMTPVRRQRLSGSE
jgi:hypothetical protein